MNRKTIFISLSLFLGEKRKEERVSVLRTCTREEHRSSHFPLKGRVLWGTLGAALVILVALVVLVACPAAPSAGGANPRYLCENGTPVDETTDTTGQTRCASCDGGYTLENEACRANRYVCLNGTPSSLRDATADGLSRCVSCNTGWYLRTVQHRCVDELLTSVYDVTDSGGLGLELSGAISVTTATVGGTPYLFVAGQSDNGVSVFSIANNGALTNVDNVTDAGSLEINTTSSVTTATIGSTPYLFVAGQGDGGVSVFSIGTGGALTNVYNVTDGGSLELEGATSVTTATVGGTPYLFVAGSVDDGVSVFSIANNGALASTHDVTDDATLELDGAYSVTTATIGSASYLFVAGRDDHGVSVFSIANSGMLTSVHDVTDDAILELEGADSVTTATIGGTPYLFVAGQEDSGLSVFSIGTGGALTNVHNEPDAGSLELEGATSVTTATIGGSSYLFAAGFTDSGVSVFSIANNGVLTNVHNEPDAGSLELEGATSVTTATIGGSSYLFAAGFTDSGVSVFSINE